MELLRYRLRLQYLLVDEDTGSFSWENGDPRVVSLSFLREQTVLLFRTRLFAHSDGTYVSNEDAIWNAKEAIWFKEALGVNIRNPDDPDISPFLSEYPKTTEYASRSEMLKDWSEHF